VALEFHDEPLHLGLHNARHPAFLPKGALARTDNTRYRPGDYALYPAEGRAKVGGGGHSPVVISQMTALEWDPGTEVAPSQEGDFRQILYITRDDSGNHVRTIRAAADPSHGVMAPGAARTLVVPGGIGFGASPLVKTEFKNQFVIATGGESFVVRRKAGVGEEIIPHGMKEQTIVLQCKTNTTDVITGFKDGIYWFWFTWYNATYDIEGTMPGWKPLTIQNPSIGPNAVGVIASGNGATQVRSARLYVKKTVFDLAKPSNATHVRVYVGLQAANTTGAFLNQNPWPLGFRIQENEIATLPVEFVDGTHPAACPNGAVRADVVGDCYQIASVFGPADVNGATTQIPFEAVRIIEDGETLSAGKRGKPPRSTAVISFNESILANDLDDRRKSRFSFPLDIHAFPVTFYINHESAEWDEVVGYQTDGRVAGVYLKNRVIRVNYLPARSDSNFRAGKVQDVIIERYGAVSGQAIARFTLGDGRPMSAHAAMNGIWFTDFFTAYKATENISWKKIIGEKNLDDLRGAQLRDNPDQERLEFYYPDPAFESNFPTKALYLQYGAMHLQQSPNGHPLPTVTGPIDLDAGVAASSLATVDGGTRRVVTTDKFGNIYYGDFGWKDEGSPDSLIPNILTREIYPAGLSKKANVKAVVTHFSPANAGGGARVGLSLLPEGEPINYVVLLEHISNGAGVSGLHTKAVRQNTRSLQLSATADPGTLFPFGVNLLGIWFEALETIPVDQAGG
jgi:hypothetical protein